MKGKEYENRTVSFAISSKGEKMKVENISYRVDHRILFDNRLVRNLVHFIIDDGTN